MRNRAKSNRHVALTAIFFAVTNTLCQVEAQTTTRDTLSYKLEETVITAVKPVESVKSASPIFKIDEASILRTGITDISDAIHRLPGVTLKDYGGAGGLKTVSVRGLGAAHTVVTYDGLPLSDAQSGAIDLSRYSVDNLGSLSLVIGDNDDIFIPVKTATAPATLNLITPSELQHRNTELVTQFKVGSFGYLSPFLRWNQKLSERWIIGFTGDFIHTKNDYPFKLINGDVTTTEHRDNSRMNSGHVEGSLRWSNNRNSTVTAKVYYYDNDRKLPGPVIYYNVKASKEQLHEKNAFGQAVYEGRFNEQWQLRVAGKFNWSASLYTDYGARQGENYLKENYFQREYYFTANLLYKLSRILQLDYSADYIFNDLNSNLKDDSKPSRNSILQSVSARLTFSRISMTARLIESIYLNSSKPGTTPPANHNRLSPSVNISGRLMNNELFYARLSYKNTFRMPTFNEAFFNHYGSPNLQPESTEQIDFGLSYQLRPLQWLPQLMVTADVYRNWVRDRIVAVPYNMFIWNVTNLNSVHVLGADVTLSSTINLGKRNSLILTGTWSYQKARINVKSSASLYGKQVAYTPLNSGSFSASWENPWVNIVFHGQGCSERFSNNSNIPETRLPGYVEFGTTLWRQIPLKSHRFELRFDIINMFDKQYSVIARYPMPGRSFMGTIKFTL
ncbi:MAG: TonB-dependent receptor plug domain-containing protein [Muribaculaceae bacterium]|nr:TonB-dependent receptor plug domain-containing protein [Muribaculaceae bacterium]